MRKLLAGSLAAAATVAAALGAVHAWPDEDPHPDGDRFRELAGPQPPMPPGARHWFAFAEGSRPYEDVWSADAFRAPTAASHHMPLPDFAPLLRARAALARAHAASGVLPAAPIPPLSEAERSFFEPLRMELAIDAWFMRNLGGFVREAGPWLRLLPYKPNRSYNLHVANNMPVLRMAALPAAELARAYAARPPRLHRVGWVEYVINGRGVWALEMADASHLYGRYMLAAHDLEALIVLVNAAEDQARRGAGLAPDSSGGFFRTGGERFGNPYAPGEPPAVSPDGRELRFASRPGEKDPVRLRLAVPLGPGK